MKTKEKRTKIKQIEKQGIWGIKYTIIPNFVEVNEFISKDEIKLYRCLEEIYKTTSVKISMQVALNRIVKINTERNKKKLEQQYCSRSIDFVLYDINTNKIICCIELNGNSHERKDRKERDEFLTEIFELTNIPLIFIKSKTYYYQEEIKKEIDEAIKNKI